MATTTNYSWTTPDDTALVKDGALAIRTLGSSVDTTVKNLNPETTTGAISYRGATANQKTALPIGTAGQVLQVNSGATAPEWATLAAGGMTSLASGSIAASSTGFDLTSIPSTYNELWLYITAYSMDTTSSMQLKINNNGSADYANLYSEMSATWTVSSGQTIITLIGSVNGALTTHSAYVRLPNYKNSTGFKHYEWAATRQDNEMWIGKGFTRATAAIDRLTVTCSAGSFDNGTYELFGVK